MKVTGFSFVRNAVKYGYPIRESILSILPVCDDFVIAVGNSDDGTRQLIESINDPKIKIIDTTWDESLRKGGEVLAVETNKAFAAVSAESDWAFYIQGDEAVHEKYLDTIYKAMQQYKDDKRVDGLLFKYLHFWGSYDYFAQSSRWYRNEIRIIRNDKNIYSYRDAQGFRKGDNEKLLVKPIDAYIYHYGWVREPKVMQNKKSDFGQLWGEYDNTTVAFDKKEFDYNGIDTLKLFKETHPEVMRKLIQQKNWQFDYDISKNKTKLKDRFKNFLEDITGHRFFDYQNYKILR
ncbi:MAG: glycosyltransferase family 2 protein [Chitinophagaceae bacterium]